MADENPMRASEPMSEDPPSPPLPQSYWVLPGRLLAGPYPGHMQPGQAAPRLRALLAAGVTHVINLMEPIEDNGQGSAFPPYQTALAELAAAYGITLAHSRHPIPDGFTPSPATMTRILDEIDAALSAGQVVYIHCWGGKGRTGTVVGCYLARHGLASGAQALEQITALRQAIHPPADSPETDEQCRFVAGWPGGA